MEKSAKQERCPCGSGKKQRECCGTKQGVILIQNVLQKEVGELQQELLDYALATHGEAIGDFLWQRTSHLSLDEDQKEIFMFYMIQWAMFCAPLVYGQTIVQHYMQTHGSRIKRTSLRNAIRSWSAEAPSFVRVIGKQEQMVMAVDLFTHEQKRIDCSLDDWPFEAGSLLVGLFVPIGAAYIPFLSCLEIRNEKADLVADMLCEEWLEQSERSSRAQIADAFPELLHRCLITLAYESFTAEDLQWEDPSHERTAFLLQKKMNELHGEPALTNIAVMLWRIYCSLAHPRVKKAELYAAAMHYLTVATFVPYKVVTQKEVAEHYRVPIGSLSAKYREMEEALGEFIEYMYDNMELLENDSFSFADFLEGGKDLEPERRNVPLSPREQAQELVDQAFAEPNRQRRIELAHEALQRYPNMPAAYDVLGESASTPQEAARYYKKGMDLAEQELGPAYFREHKGHFWELAETRPYMNVKAGYARALWEAGEQEKAIKQYQQLLQLNPNDHQGIRYELLLAYMELGKYDEAEELLQEYDEPTAVMRYNRLLVSYGKYGLYEELDDLLHEAVEANRHVVDYLLKKKRLPKEAPPFFMLGEESEAVLYVRDHLHLWQREPELLQWLRMMAPSGKLKK